VKMELNPFWSTILWCWRSWFWLFAM
jgi:hypothetical protein